jgi:hypothetical protein
MKWLGLLLLLFSLDSFGQCKTFLKNPKGEIINCTDTAGKRQGYWLVRVEPLRGNPGYDEEGYYKDGLKEGVWYMYSKMGDLMATEYYKWGMKDSINLYYNITAGLIREESWKAVNPSDPWVEVEVEDPLNPGTFNKVRVKLEGKSYKHGTWRLYDPQTGALVKTEVWYMNENEADRKKKQIATSGSTATSSDSTKPAPKKIVPKEVQDFEKKNAGKKKVKVRDGRTGG